MMWRQGNEICIDHCDPLTRREAQVLLWAAEGKTAWEAGMILGIQEGTAAAHLASARAKLRASNLPHLITRAFVQGILRAKTTIVLLVMAAHIAVCVAPEKTAPFIRRAPEVRVARAAHRTRDGFWHGK